MKKLIYGAMMFFAIQSGFAQTQDAKTFVNNTVNTDAIKQQILPMIDTAKVDDFNKEFDALVNGFVTDFSKLVDENFKVDSQIYKWIDVYKSLLNENSK